MTAIADQLPDAIDDDDDWLGKMLAEDATKTINPAPAEAWKSSDSPVAQLRQELVDELKPTTHAPAASPTEVEPNVADLPPIDEPDDPAPHELSPLPPQATPPESQKENKVPPPVMAEESLLNRPAEPALPEGSLSSDEVASLMSPAADDPPPTKPPVDPAGLTDDARAICPAGLPKPKIDLKAMQKSKGAPADQVARLFGDKSAPTKDPESDRPSLTFEEPVVVEKQLPRVLLLLDEATNRVRKIHGSLPTLAGLAGVALVGHGTLIAILATLGWI